MEQSILKSTKKVLGLADGHDEFDEDVVMHINAAFGVLNQLGIGAQGVFSVDGDDEEWADFGVPADQLALAKQYIFLKVRMAFDPPQTSYHLTAAEKQLDELVWRINAMREALL